MGALKKNAPAVLKVPLRDYLSSTNDLNNFFCFIMSIIFIYCCLYRLFFSYGNFLCCNTFFFLALQFCATLGTTPCCSFDKLLELGPICKSLLLLSKISDTSLSHAESFPGHYEVSVSKYI